MVVFEDHFWGEKHAGFDVLYQNMKQGQSAAKELADFMRDRVSSEENYGKLLHRLAKSSSSVTSLGSFQPWWEIVRSSTEKVASIHFQVMQKLLDVIKDLKDYGDILKEKHKTAKDDFSSTSEIVQAMQTTSATLLKAKEVYHNRCAELERAKKENSKDLEKMEQKVKKATEEYKCLVEKREEVRSQFVIRMRQTCKKFEKLESEHLKAMKGYIGKYLDSLESGHLLIGQMFNDFKTQLSNLPADKLIQSFVNEKQTGKETPDVITFELFKGGPLPSPTEPATESQNNIPRTHSTSTFLKKKRKEKKKKKKAEKNNVPNGSIGSPSSESGEAAVEAGASPTAVKVDEEGYTIRPPDAESISNKSRSSFSDSDSEEEEPVKIHVKINPVENGSAVPTASIDELKALTKGLTLQSPSTLVSNRKEGGNGEGSFVRGKTRSSGDLQKNQSKGFSSSSDLLDICFSNDSLPGKMTSDSVSLSSHSSSTPPEESKSPLDDLSFLDPIRSPSVTSSKDEVRSNGSNSSLFDIAEVPPELPVKKSHTPSSQDEDSAPEPSPPPLPIKRASVMGSKGNHSPKANTKATFIVGSIREETPGTSSNEDVSSSVKLQNAETSKFPAPIRPPPIGGEITRSSSLGSMAAVPRPKPGSLQAKLGGGLVPPPRNNTITPRATNTLLALSAFSAPAEERKSTVALAPLATEDPFGGPPPPAFKADFSKGFANFDDNFSSGFETNFTETGSIMLPAKESTVPSTSSSNDLRSIFEEALKESEAIKTSSGRNTPTSTHESETANSSLSVATNSLLEDDTGSMSLTRTSTISALGIAPPVKGAISTLPRANTTGSMLPNKTMTLPHSVSRKDTAIPIAVAFIECVNAVFKGSDLSRCVAKVTGDMTISFPASIIPVLATSPAPPLLTFQMNGMNTLEQIIPNKTLLTGDGSVIEGDVLEYSFNMPALATHLRKQAEQGTASYYNIDILKYQVKLSASSFQSTPLQLCSFWKCEKLTTDLRIDFKYNGSCLSSPSSISNVSVIAPVDGEVTVMRSKPPATWSSESQRAVWKIPEISSTEPQGPGYLRARFDVPGGPSTPSPLSVQFSCEGATISRVNFELNNKKYRVSLVKKRFNTGKYIVEPSAAPGSSNC